MSDYLVAFLFGFGISLIASPFVYKLAKKLKAEQTILHYVKTHKEKEGTPTFGGLIFLIGFVVSALLLLKKDSTLALVAVGSTFSFAILGFLDDFIKIKFKQNEGLKAYQKLTGQIGIGLILSMFVYVYLGSKVFVPFTFIQIDLGLFIVPLTLFVFLALVNSVNLVDGLDGLAGSVSVVYIFSIVMYLILFQNFFQASTSELTELNNLIIVSFIMMGCLILYLLVNVYPAKIFMGDTGSLALGGFLTAISVFSKMTLFIPILGIVFVVTAFSDVLQVLVYKKTKKRVFKMAPFHHHLQMSGFHENKIVFFYSVLTLIACVVNILFTNLINFGV